MNLEEHVDLGSWARFEPTLAAFLDGPARPDGTRPGTTLLLTAPAPVVVGGPAPAAGLLARLRRRRAGPVSPHPPGMALTGRADGVEIVLPVLDARGGALLGPEQVDSLQALGWRPARSPGCCPTARQPPQRPCASSSRCCAWPTRPIWTTGSRTPGE